MLPQLNINLAMNNTNEQENRLFKDKSNRRVSLHSVVTIGLVGLSALLPSACAKKAPDSIDRPPAPVTVATAISRDVPLYLDEVGKCVAREVVSIQPQASGKITEILFTDGAGSEKRRTTVYYRSKTI